MIMGWVFFQPTFMTVYQQMCCVFYVVLCHNCSLSFSQFHCAICLFTIFEKVFEEDIDPVSYIEEHGLKIVEDTGLLNDTLQKILEENPGPLEELLGGKEKVFGFFVGKMMRELKGKASPDAVREALVKEVEKRKNQ